MHTWRESRREEGGGEGRGGRGEGGGRRGTKMSEQGGVSLLARSLAFHVPSLLASDVQLHATHEYDRLTSVKI